MWLCLCPLTYQGYSTVHFPECQSSLCQLQTPMMGHELSCRIGAICLWMKSDLVDHKWCTIQLDMHTTRKKWHVFKASYWSRLIASFLGAFYLYCLLYLEQFYLFLTCFIESVSWLLFILVRKQVRSYIPPWGEHFSSAHCGSYNVQKISKQPTEIVSKWMFLFIRM